MDGINATASGVGTDAALAAIEEAPTDRPFVVAQLGQSLDGRIATLSGESRWINQRAALVHLHRLRASVDAVVVGVGTVIADDPLLNVRLTSGRDPARVIVDPSGRMPANARCLGDQTIRRIVVRAADGPPPPPGVEGVTIARQDGVLPPQAIVEALWRRGLRRLLIEGGAFTVSTFLDAGIVDRLHVLVAPIILGSGKTGLMLAPIDRLDQSIRPTTRVHLLEDGEVLFDCDLRARRAAFSHVA